MLFNSIKVIYEFILTDEIQFLHVFYPLKKILRKGNLP